MRGLKSVFDFYLNSSIHVALAVVAMTWVTLLDFEIEDSTILWFNFFATITGYNFVKYFGLAKFHHRSLANWLQVIQIFSAISFLVLIYFTLKLNGETIMYLVIFGLITFFYAIPVLPKSYFLNQEKNLRSISGFKIYVIAFVWSCSTVIIPLINNEISVSNEVLIVALQRFLIVLVWILPFEIRDIKYDSIKLSTLPQKIGILQAKIAGTLMTVLFFGLNFFRSDINYSEMFVLFLISLISIGFLVFSKKHQDEYYSSFWVEAIPIYWLIIAIVF
ncbi:hypothetical protein SAMN03097699_3237 [Flavobacteriaceae bacterium MAR_2010_188]|nr:hypothetical protein SAMN03097699_3237 [Flavobacteriaceae bacterium MAR_2010_188]